MDYRRQISKCKARCVALVFAQAPGLDYHEIYAPTARLSTLRTMLACVQHGVKFRQLDIKTANLNAPIYEIYSEEPGGFKSGNGDLVCKLKRTPYGLKRSGSNWFQWVSELLENLGFTSWVYDRCLWTVKRGRQIAVWVDCGDLTWNLGISSDVSADRMSLSQSMCISNLLEKLRMESVKPVTAPVAERLNLSKDHSPVIGSDAGKQIKQVDYKGLVGSHSYLVQTTRPDLAFSVHPL